MVGVLCDGTILLASLLAELTGAHVAGCGVSTHTYVYTFGGGCKKQGVHVGASLNDLMQAALPAHPWILRFAWGAGAALVCRSLGFGRFHLG